ncbi:hypothetical protein SCATT_p06390 (plasmid) [Streptantibioticus cattleyicolor NRRL 8057 = DSM 46488]|uniref:Uncharacterized protein n=1 Tax=Streptantibioticus cattleyicolor (strain ATCC 35852 / DSM 46488 / JCM 4925 / NBRC 14057 / NRRL 8057) TaxID=1003195 RepID=G8XH86_STREN|nr:hypothetical protein SCATT_p06390 [Streptantibioticus cattleyicolor NRRL 8057 = DSM 46488]
MTGTGGSPTPSVNRSRNPGSHRSGSSGAILGGAADGSGIGRSSRARGDGCYPR